MGDVYRARERLYRLARGMDGPVLPSAVNAALDDYEAAVRATAAPVAAPDPSRLAEAVREACVAVCDHERGCIDTATNNPQCNKYCDIRAIRSLDLAPIIAASGTGQGEASATEGWLAAIKRAGAESRGEPCQRATDCPWPPEQCNGGCRVCRTPRKEQKP